MEPLGTFLRFLSLLRCCPLDGRSWLHSLLMVPRVASSVLLGGTAGCLRLLSKGVVSQG